MAEFSPQLGESSLSLNWPPSRSHTVQKRELAPAAVLQGVVGPLIRRGVVQDRVNELIELLLTTQLADSGDQLAGNPVRGLAVAEVQRPGGAREPVRRIVGETLRIAEVASGEEEPSGLERCRLQRGERIRCPVGIGGGEKAKRLLHTRKQVLVEIAVTVNRLQGPHAVRHSFAGSRVRPGVTSHHLQNRRQQPLDELSWGTIRRRIDRITSL